MVLSTEGPPALSAQPVSADHGPPAPPVVRSVPPTAVRLASSSGQGPLARSVESSPLAVRNVWPCAAISLKIGSSVAKSSCHPHEVLSCLLVLSLAMRLSTLSAVLPT